MQLASSLEDLQIPFDLNNLFIEWFRHEKQKETKDLNYLIDLIYLMDPLNTDLRQFMQEIEGMLEGHSMAFINILKFEYISTRIKARDPPA